MLKSVIVLTNSIDESEKIKSLSSFNVATFDLRYISALELAEYLLQLSGISYKEQFVKNDLIAAAIYEKVRSIDYFSLFTYNDVLNLVSTLEDLRYQIIDNEQETIFAKLPTDKFVAKNNAVKQAYETLVNYLEENNYIDEVGIIRLALEKIKPKEDIEFKVYEKSHLRPLEIALLNKAAGKEIKETPINEEDKKLEIKSYTKAFGQTNEIEDIINYIYKKNIPFDQCLIASAEEANYSNILSNYRDLLKAPITIGVGKLITSTGPGKLFALLDDWMTNHYRYEYLLKVIDSEAFDVEKFKKDINIDGDLSVINEGLGKRYQIDLHSVTEIVGRLKVSFDNPEENLKKYDAYEALIRRYYLEKYHEDESESRYKSMGYVRKFIEIINLGMVNFIDNYSVIRDPKVDENALGKILRMLSFEKEYDIKHEDVRTQLFAQKIGREKPQPGSLYFTSISRAVSCLRKYLFITGLSSNNYPGSSKENPLLLDRDYKPFGLEEASNREIKNNKENYEYLLEEAKKYDVEIHLSWSSYNSESLKTQNSSSVVFETYKKENGEKKTLANFTKEFPSDKYRYIEYFASNLLPISSIGKALVNNKPNSYVLNEEKEEEVVPVLSLKNRPFSASAVTTFATCPYLFYLQYVLGVEQPEDIDVFEVISANEYGTMAHDLLEHLDKTKTSEEEFVTESLKRFDEYLVLNPSDNAALVENCREKFLKMMQNAYEMEGNELTAFREKDIFYKDKNTGLTIHGFPDKVIKNTDGTYRIVDYKTGHRVRHKVDNIPSMIQCTLYAYILEKSKHVKVTSFEYRYLRNKVHVYSTNLGYTMDMHYENLEHTLKELKQALETGKFVDQEKAVCSGCYFKDVCSKNKS